MEGGGIQVLQLFQEYLLFLSDSSLELPREKQPDLS